MTKFRGEYTTGREVVEALKERVVGRTIIITGPSAGGIGAETALCLAHAHPHQLILTGRDVSKISPVIESIRNIDSSVDVRFVQCDLGNQASIRAAAETIKSILGEKKIDILINNAGVMVCPYGLTADGIEMQFGTNHVGHFLLTNLLLDCFPTAGSDAAAEKPGQDGQSEQDGLEKVVQGRYFPRIVNLTSIAHIFAEFDIDNIGFKNGTTYQPWVAYSYSKSANMLFTRSLTEKLKQRGILAYSVQPGSVVSNLQRYTADTSLLDESRALNAAGNRGDYLGHPKTLQEGCSTTLVAALDPDLDDHTGAYLNNAEIDPIPLRAWVSDPDLAEQLWRLSEDMVGQKFL